MVEIDDTCFRISNFFCKVSKVTLFEKIGQHFPRGGGGGSSSQRALCLRLRCLGLVLAKRVVGL